MSPTVFSLPPSRRCALAFALLAVLGPLGVTARAQDVADPVDPIEDKALREEAAARFEEALETFEQAFDASVQQAAAGGAARERNLARAEVLLEKLSSLSERTTKQGETEKFLSKYDDPSLGAVLGASVRFERARSLLAEGDRAGAAKLAEELGLVRRWWILGPYDNERGRGFRVAKEPEKGIDLDGTYDGKDAKKVAWRQLPVDDLLAHVNLDALLRPNDQALAYAAAFVKSAGERDATVRIGSDEALKAWWNGQEVLSRDVRRELRFDQDVVGVHLRGGWNVLLLKVHDQTGPWGFRVRLTAPDGGRLDGITVAASRAEADEALRSKPEAAAFAGQVAGGAKPFYDAAVAAGGAQLTRDLFHLGWLHWRRGFDSTAERKAEGFLKRAAEAEPTNAVYRFHYAEAAAPPVEMAVEKEENHQRIGREKTLELDPGYAVAYRALAGYYTDSLQNLERAEALLRKALEINADWLEARLDLARVLEMRGMPAAADLERNRALDDPRAAALESVARARAAGAERRNLGPAASNAWREVLRLDARGNDVRRKVAELAAQAMKRDEAVALLDEIHAWDPYDTGTLQRKAEIFEGAADWAVAEAALREALVVAPEDENLLQALGRVQAKKGDAKAALATFREALRVNPKLQGLERYVEFLDPEAAPFEDDFRIDVAPLVARAEDWKNEENDGWLVLLDHTVTRVNRDGTSATYAHAAVKILTDAGIEQFDRYRAPGWGDEAFKWKAARVLRLEGGQRKALEAKTDTQMRMADFPPLVAGDVIDMEYRRDQRHQSVFGDYFGDVFYFADRVPVLQSTYTLVTPAERTFHFHQRKLDVKPVEAMRDEGKTRVWTWTMTDIAKVREEPLMPNPRELFPQVQVTTYANWSEFARWWSNLIRDQQIVSPEIKKKVDELVAGKESRFDKVRAIYDFVTGDITYQAWPFGPHGYKTYTTTAIFDKREGDCKDKALLFNTMLREIGVEAWPVLIYAEGGPRSEEDLTLAMLGNFNHCISFVPDADGKGTPMWFDGTAEYSCALVPPSSDQGAKVLVVKPEGAEVTTLPLSPPEKLGIVQRWNVKVAPDGGAEAKAEFTWRGDMAIFLRQRFSVEGQRPLILQGLFSRALGKLKLVSHDFDDLKDRSKAEASFRATLELPGFAKEAGDGLTLPTAFLDMMGGFAGGIAARPEREHDLVLPNPMAFRTEATYELPAGWTVVAPPEDAKIELPTASFTSAATVEGSTLKLVREFQVRGGRVKPAEYAEFREALNRGVSLAAQTWKVKKGEAPAPAPTPAPAEK